MNDREVLAVFKTLDRVASAVNNALTARLSNREWAEQAAAEYRLLRLLKPAICCEMWPR